MHKIVFFAILVVILPATLFAQSHIANVLYSDRPLPIQVGIEVGATYTTFTNATPNYFAVTYPYSNGPDTIHMQFPNGFTPLTAWHVGISSDFWLNNAWGILLKLNYNERRGHWNSVVTAQAGQPPNQLNVPLTNDLVLLLRYATFEAYARYRFEKLHGLYIGAGLAVNALLSDHYDIEQTLGGPPSVSFVDFGTGRATGIKDYTVGGSFGKDLNTILAEVKFLVGYPIHIGYRWSLDPQLTVAIPITQLFSSPKQNEYKALGFSAPNPLTFAGIIALRYEF